MKTTRLLLAAAFGLLASLTSRADTVELLPGKIAGTVHLSSETIQSGSIYANATDGSGSASTSFNGETYSMVVPAGKTWRLTFYFNMSNGSGGSSSLSFSPPDQISVAASTTVTHDVSLVTARITADVQVSNGTLSSVNSLQVYGNDGTTSFSASAYSMNSAPALVFNNVSIYGTATVASTTNQTSTQSLASQNVNVSSSGVTATWSLDAAFAAGSLQGAVNLQGAATPNSSSLNLYGPNYSYVGSKYLNAPNGNGSFQFDNLQVGSQYLYAYTSFTDAQLNFYRNTSVSAGSVTTENFAYTVSLAHIGLNLTGFLTPATISGASISGNGPDNTSASANLKSTGGFTAVVIPGDWTFASVNLYGYDTSVPTDYLYYSINAYDYTRSGNPVTFAAGVDQTLAPFSLNTTQTELTFDVVEQPGATTETLISYPSVNGYTSVVNSSGQTTGYVSVNGANYGSPQAKPRVRIIGTPGVYTLNAYGTVENSQVSFGSFQLELKVPLPTPVGSNVTVQPSPNATLVFDHVTAAGVTTSSELPVGPQVPAGFTPVTNNGTKTFYNISTTATFDGYVNVSLNYDPAAVPVADTSHLHLLSYDNATQTWIDVTTGVDTAAHTVTGVAPALSLFVLAITHDPVIGAVTVPANALKDTSLSFSATFTDSDSGDHHTATWSWGDGSTSAGSVTETPGTVTGSHSYAQAGTYHGTLTVTDSTGTAVSQPFTVVVGGGDSTAPVITVPADVTAEAGGPDGAVVTFTTSALDDTDGTVTTTASPASGSLFPVGTTTVTVTSKDAAGNVGTKTFKVTVADSTAPTIAGPTTVSAEATSAAGATVTFTVGAIDLVDGAITVTTDHASGSTFPVGSTTVTATARDAAGNTATKTFTVTVVDSTAPVIAPTVAVTAEATSATGAVVTFTTSATDLVDGSVTVTADHASGSTFPLGATTVTLTAKDAAGNTSTSSFVVTVTDLTAPAITPVAAVTAEATSTGGAVVTFTTSATDLVDGTVTVTADHASGSTFPLGATTVTLTAKDASGNTSTSSFVVTVKDTTAPVIAALASVQVEATSAAGAAATFAPTATDALGATVTTSIASGTVFPIGTTTVTVTATDAAGNTSTASFTVNVKDTSAPAVTVPANIIADATSASGAVVTFSASATDAVGATLTYSKASGTVFPFGTTLVTVTATDSSGNVTTKTFTVTVKDTTGPVLALPANLVVEATGDEGTKVNYTVSAADLVSGASVVTLSKPSGSRFPLGVTTVTATAKDALGNLTTGSFTVTVKDTTAPKLKLPANPTVKAKSAAGAKVSFEASATDLVDDHVKITYSKAPGSTFPIGTTTVTVTATDDAGNVSTGTFTVTVADKTKPEFTKLSVNPSVLTGGNHQMVAVTVTALAKDAIDAALDVRIVSVTSDEPATGTGPGDVGPDYQITGPLTLNLRNEYDPKGNGRIYTITVTATDDAGNTRTQTVHVLVGKKSSTRFEDCDDHHRTESQRRDDDDRDCRGRDRGDDDDND